MVSWGKNGGPGEWGAPAGTGHLQGDPREAGLRGVGKGRRSAGAVAGLASSRVAGRVSAGTPGLRLRVAEVRTAFRARAVSRLPSAAPCWCACPCR